MTDLQTEAIHAERLTKFYGTRRGIEDVDLSVSRGEVFGFLGPNGAGKTTTIRIILDFLRPTRGTVRALGLTPQKDGVALRAKLGYLPGDLGLYDDLTGAELLRFAQHLRHGVDETYVRHLVQRFDCNPSVRIRSLSRGNKQKLGIILAFMHKPELLVLDEPTSGLDPIMQHEFNRLALEARAEGRTVFVSSHILPEVEEVCDRVGIIRDGCMAVVDHIAILKQRAVRTVEVHFAAPVQAEDFERVPGVKIVSVEGTVLRCSVQGVMDPLIKRLSAFTVDRIITHEPTLEDAFLAYYSGGLAEASRVS